MSAKNLNKLFIGNLPWTMGSREIRQYFSKYGAVRVANVIFDKNSGIHKGYGFVTFNSKTDYDNVLNLKHSLEGKQLNVQPVNDD